MAENSLAKKDEMALVFGAGSGGLDVGGLEGADEEDVMIPNLRLVQDNSKEVDLVGGGRASAGVYYHSQTRQTMKEVDVVILLGKKRKLIDNNPSSRTVGEEVSSWRVLMSPVAALEKPFVMYFKKMANWQAWKPFINSMSGKNFWDYVIRIGTKQVTNKKGEMYYIPTFAEVGPTTEEQKDYAAAALARFGEAPSDDDDGEEVRADQAVPSEEAPRKTKKKEGDPTKIFDGALDDDSEEVDAEEIPF